MKRYMVDKERGLLSLHLVKDTFYWLRNTTLTQDFQLFLQENRVKFDNVMHLTYMANEWHLKKN